MHTTNHQPHAGGTEALKKYDAARTAFIASLRAEPAMDRKRIEIGLADLMDAFDDIHSIAQQRMAAATSLVISELAKAGRWFEVQCEIDGFYCDDIAACAGTAMQGAA